MTRTIILTLLLLLSTYSFAKSPKDYAKEFIVDKASNCGALGYEKDPAKIKTCILEKLTNLENFYAWFWFKSGETNPATGLMMKDGLLYITWYDNIGKGKDAYFLYHLCDQWDLLPNDSKPIKCVMQNPKTKIHLFEMDSLVELTTRPKTAHVR